MNTQVYIYSTPTCHWCHTAKDYFNENNIKYTDFDVSSNMEKLQEMRDKSGQMGVPVIVIDKEGVSENGQKAVKSNVIIGFNKSAIDSLLSLGNFQKLIKKF
jgi:glutaredoxin-like YruB-family protein